MATRWTALLAALVAAFAAACGDEEAGQPVPLEPASGIARVDARTPVIGVSEPNGWRREPAPASPDEIARLLADLGATSQRFVVDWSLVEPRAPVGGEHAYDFAAFDAMYEADLIHGIRPLLVVLNAPAWAWDPGAIGGAFVNNPPAADRLREWAAFVEAVTRRYPEALGVEIWNEPNLSTFWGGQGGSVAPDPVRYTDLLRASYDAVKSVDPAMPVIGGALAANQFASAAGDLPATEFARAMYEDGAAAHMDAISLHPYPGAEGVARTVEMIEQVRAAIDEMGAATPMWLTEIGVTTSGPAAVSEPEQADALGDLCRAALEQPRVAALYFHNLLESPRTTQGPEPGYGLVQPLDGALREKPAFAALRAELSRPERCAA